MSELLIPSDGFNDYMQTITPASSETATKSTPASPSTELSTAAGESEYYKNFLSQEAPATRKTSCVYISRRHKYKLEEILLRYKQQDLHTPSLGVLIDTILEEHINNHPLPHGEKIAL